MEMKPVLLLLGDDNPNYPNDPRIKALQEKVDFDMQIITNAGIMELESRIKNKEVAPQRLNITTGAG
jgi:nitrogenase molybdenum-iron protein beta chain